MSAKKQVEKMLDKYSMDELLEDSSIDMSPFIEFLLEELGSDNDDDLDDFESAIDEAMEATEVDEDDQDILWNRTALLLFSGIVKDEDGELTDLYTGVEGQLVVLAGIAFGTKVEEREEPDWSMLLNLRMYLKDFAEAVWRLDGDPEMASEMLCQAMEAARICAEGEEYEDCLKIASSALELFENEVDENTEGIREPVGLLWYYMGEGEEDDETAAGYYRNAIDILDDPEVLDDPEYDDTPEILEDLKSEWLDEEE